MARVSGKWMHSGMCNRIKIEEIRQLRQLGTGQGQQYMRMSKTTDWAVCLDVKCFLSDQL